jgi:hypothetical protein
MTEEKDYQGKDETSLPEEEDLDFDPWADKPWKRWSLEEQEFHHWMDYVSEAAAENDQWYYLMMVKKAGIFGQEATPEQFSELLQAKVIVEIQLKDGKTIQMPGNLKCEVIYDEDLAFFVARKKSPDPEPKNQE